MEIQIVSLSRNAVIEVEALQLLTSHGQIQVLDQHADLVSVVVPGALSLTKPLLKDGMLGEGVEVDPAKTTFFVGDGYLRVENGAISLMVDRFLIGSSEGLAQAKKRAETIEALAEPSEEESRELEILKQFLAVS